VLDSIVLIPDKKLDRRKGEMIKKIVWLGLSLLFVASLVVTSCGPAEEGEEEVTAKDTPQYGGTITFVDFSTGTSVWDPNLDNFGTAATLGGILCERLLAIPYYKGRTGTGEYEFVCRWVPEDAFKDGAGLTESWEWVDGTTVVFHIREGVMWPAKPSIGLDEPRELTAEDVAFVYNTALESERVTTLKTLVESVEVLDRYSVRFNLKHFHSDWTNDLSFQFRFIYSPEAYEAGITDWKNIHGTGAYQIAEVVPDVSIFCDKNPDYWQHNYRMPDGKTYQLPFADHVVFAVISDEASRVAALRTGKIDAINSLSWTYHESLTQSCPELRYWTCNWVGAYIIGMREDKDLPFNDKNVRLALSMALDRDEINNSLMGGTPIDNFPIPSTWNEAYNVDIYTPLEERSNEIQEAYSYNPEKARKLLAEAGYPDGFKTSMEYMSGALVDDLAAWVKDSWAKIDVEVTLLPQTGMSGYSRERDLLFDEMELAFESTFSPYEAFDNLYSWGLRNFSIVRDPYIDEQVNKIAAEQDLTKRISQWKALCQYGLERMDYVALPYTKLYNYAWPWIKNFEGENFLSYYSMAPAFMYAWVDQSLKKSMGY
jgi:peptide/nickel transport system substrate-binding protein